MSMFCYQCEQSAAPGGCTVQGVCGKTAPVANLQDELTAALVGLLFNAWFVHVCNKRKLL